jgi:hypothetical protein
VSVFNGGTSNYRSTSIAPVAGATLVANYSDDVPLVAYKGSVVALNFYPPSSDARSDFWVSSTDGAKLLVNALRFQATPAATPAAVPALSQIGMLILAVVIGMTTLFANCKQRV